MVCTCGTSAVTEWNSGEIFSFFCLPRRHCSGRLAARTCRPFHSQARQSPAFSQAVGRSIVVSSCRVELCLTDWPSFHREAHPVLSAKMSNLHFGAGKIHYVKCSRASTCSTRAIRSRKESLSGPERRVGNCRSIVTVGRVAVTKPSVGGQDCTVVGGPSSAHS